MHGLQGEAEQCRRHGQRRKGIKGGDPSRVGEGRIYAIEADRIRDGLADLSVFAAEALEKAAIDTDVANQTIASLETQLVESQEGMISVDFVASMIEASHDRVAELETDEDFSSSSDTKDSRLSETPSMLVGGL